MMDLEGKVWWLWVSHRLSTAEKAMDLFLGCSAMVSNLMDLEGKGLVL
jgi:hypothetical protein